MQQHRVRSGDAARYWLGCFCLGDLLGQGLLQILWVILSVSDYLHVDPGVAARLAEPSVVVVAVPGIAR